MGAFFQRLSKGTAITFNNSFGGQLKSKFCIPFGAHTAAFEEFKKFVEEAEKPLYRGCYKHTKLSGLVKLYNLKARHGMTDNCFADILIEVGTCDDSLLRLIVEDEKKIDQIKKCLWRFGRKHVDSNM
ncbi:hypothetical protein GBA52_015836 [Prunus armeniaca]|nr:hypothetical protein GBA52_015836 [Prunus armeniaca]